MLVPLPPCTVAYLCMCIWKCVYVSRVHGYVYIYEDLCWCTGCSHLFMCNLVLWQQSYYHRLRWPGGWQAQGAVSSSVSSVGAVRLELGLEPLQACSPVCPAADAGSLSEPLSDCPELGHSGGGFPGQEPKRKWPLGPCYPFWRPWGMCSLPSTVRCSLAAG